MFSVMFTGLQKTASRRATFVMLLIMTYCSVRTKYLQKRIVVSVYNQIGELCVFYLNMFIY